MKVPKTRYFIEVDGFISLDPHHGPRDAAFRSALEHGTDAREVRVIAVEGEDPLSDSAKRSIYEYDTANRRWSLRAR